MLSKSSAFLLKTMPSCSGFARAHWRKKRLKKLFAEKLEKSLFKIIFLKKDFRQLKAYASGTAFFIKAKLKDFHFIIA